MKKTITIIISAVMVLTMALSAAPTRVFAASTTAVEATSLTKKSTKDSYTVKVGKTKTLKAKVKFKKNAYSVAAVAKSFKVTTSAKGNIAITDITFKRSSDKVWTAYVKVKAAKAGKSTITVKTTKGSKKSVKWTINGKKTTTPTKPVDTKVTLNSVSVPSGDIEVGEAVKATVSPANATVSYQWHRVGLSGTDKAISGATSSSYTPAYDDLNYRFYVVVKGTGNTTGEAESYFTNEVSHTHHQWGDAELFVPATREHQGGDYYTCSVCGKTEVRNAVDWIPEESEIADYLLNTLQPQYPTGTTGTVEANSCNAFVDTMVRKAFGYLYNKQGTAYTAGHKYSDTATAFAYHLRPGDVVYISYNGGRSHHWFMIADIDYDASKVTIADGNNSHSISWSMTDFNLFYNAYTNPSTGISVLAIYSFYPHGYDY